MEFRTPSPPLPLSDWTDDSIREEFSTQLRNIAVVDIPDPANSKFSEAIGAVRQLKDEMDRRAIDLSPLLSDLTAKINRDFARLLVDVIRYPCVTPYLRGLDGIAEALRCFLCKQEERPPRIGRFTLCNSCIPRVIATLRGRHPMDELVIFRSYTPESWCPHADAETVLFTVAWDEELRGSCELCLQEEVSFRERQLM